MCNGILNTAQWNFFNLDEKSEVCDKTPVSHRSIRKNIHAKFLECRRKTQLTEGMSEPWDIAVP